LAGFSSETIRELACVDRDVIVHYKRASRKLSV
jgi:hypothetical protein